MKKRALSLLMALLLLAAMVPTALAVAVDSIEWVELNLELCVNQPLPATASVYGEHVSLVDVATESTDAVAEPGKSYEYVIKLESTDGYIFGKTCEVRVNGQPATVISGLGSEELRLSVTLKPRVSYVEELYMVTGPVQDGKHPSQNVTISYPGSFDGSASIFGWMDKDTGEELTEEDTFVVGHTYRAFFTVSDGPTTGIEYMTPLYMNDNRGYAAAGEDGTTVCFVDIVATVAIADELRMTVGPVLEGWHPSYDVTVDYPAVFDGTVTITGWMDDTDWVDLTPEDTFIAGHTYRVFFMVEDGPTTGIEYMTPLYMNGFRGYVAANGDGAAVCYLDILAGASVAGDVDGDGQISLKDVSLMFRAYSGRTVADEPNIPAADMDGDHAFTLKDVYLAFLKARTI